MTTDIYGPAAYRGSALPALPPPIRDKQGLFDTALKWGHYANHLLACEMLNAMSTRWQRGRKSAKHTNFGITTRSSITSVIVMRHSPNLACSGFIYGEGALCFLGDVDFFSYRLASPG
ncbi:hypothetical protein [Stutzerimonas stutzeri]|uniref:hypothetical protein n=1 Tax=Stutzerimonas stutzeri TaxID=316 RepID=UPI00210C14DE|nr:hypothetical protein [Stutzerimonas stutzeri]MCQ4256932.1 hypothetical protein [Stutzerimonas stutzeri]